MNRQWTRGLAIASVVLVAVVAAVISYCHMHELTLRSGEEWRSVLIPFSVDGMLVATTLAIVDRRRANLPAGWVPWTGLGLGLVASLVANIAAARPELVAQLVAAWPPVALAVSIETLVIVLRGARPSRPVQRAPSSPMRRATEVSAPSVALTPAKPKPKPQPAPAEDELAARRERERIRKAQYRAAKRAEQEQAHG
jgi:hypothetical protein